MSTGISLALLNSVVNAISDPIRKVLVSYMDPFHAIALRGLIQVPIFLLWAWLESKGNLQRTPSFFLAVGISGSINLTASFLYNRSLQLAPLSSTIPYLSFTPAFLLVNGFFILGEFPNEYGVLGILCTTMGGYWLHRQDRQQSELNENNRLGSMYMLTVAALYSISSAFDKVGTQSSSPIVYGASIQTIVTIGSFVLRHFVPSLRTTPSLTLTTKLTPATIPWKWITISAMVNVVAYWIHLLATANTKVSYVIALKRAGCIFAAIYGKIFFSETNFNQKLPPILLMVAGVGCIVMKG